MEKNSLNLMHLLAKMFLISTKMAHHLQNKQKYLMNFLRKGFLHLMITKKIKLTLMI